LGRSKGLCFGIIQGIKTRTELEQENAQIGAQLRQKGSVIESKESIIEPKDTFIDQLKEALIQARNRQFAKMTETLRWLQSELINEVEQESVTAELLNSDLDGEPTITVPAQERKRGGRSHCQKIYQGLT
jgi:hypothetical protein